MTEITYVKFDRDVLDPNGAPSRDNLKRIFTSPAYYMTLENGVVTIHGSAGVARYPFSSVDSTFTPVEAPAIVPEAPKPAAKPAKSSKTQKEV